MTGSVCVINLKGGCGKTTVSTHIAAAFALSGLDTTLADLDRQKNALLWHTLRGDRKPKIRAVDWRKSFGKVPKGTQRLVIDCPASLRVRNAHQVVKEADVVVVPILPSVYDEQSTRLFLRKLAALKPVRKGRKPILLVANRYRAGSAGARALEAFAAANEHPVVARIPDRTIYPATAENGLTVFDFSTKAMREQQTAWLPLLAAIEENLQAFG